MAKKGDLDATKHIDGDVSKPLISKKAADKRYNQSLYRVALRIPAYYKQTIEAYINGHNKSADPDNQIESVNAWIKSLIDREIGIKP